jgi:hypothetical protein
MIMHTKLAMEIIDNIFQAAEDAPPDKKCYIDFELAAWNYLKDLLKKEYQDFDKLCPKCGDRTYKSMNCIKCDWEEAV